MAMLESSSGAMVGPNLFGVPLKQIFLVTLTFQNSISILVMHYSRVMPSSGGPRYFTSTAVLLGEVIKLAMSLSFSVYENSRTLAPQTPATVLFQQTYNSIFGGDGWQLAIPATLYTLENTLQYVALSNIDAVHFQILYQLKILMTAIFSVLMLARPLPPRRWLAILLLTAGVCIVSLRSTPATTPLAIHDFSDHYFPRSAHEMGQVAKEFNNAGRQFVKRTTEEVASAILGKRSASYAGIEEDLNPEINTQANYSLGVISILVAATLSGFTGVYFEKVLKNSTTPVSVWTRNVQLSFYSLFPALFLGVIVKDGSDIAEYGFFQGYNAVVWTTIVSQAAGGMLTSLCIHYADILAKNFATSISIIVSFLFSVWFFDFEVSLLFLAGTALVLYSTFLYSNSERRRARPPPVKIVELEKAIVSSTPRNLSYTNLNMNPMDSLSLAPPIDNASLGLSTSRPSTPLRHHSRVLSARDRNRDD